jgi:hypothetical protein
MLMLAGASLARPGASWAQQLSGIPLVGVLMGATASNEAYRLGVFREALERLGWIEGKTIAIEPHYAEGHSDRLAMMARELAARAPALIACVGVNETAAAQAATRTIPIVFFQVRNPVAMGLSPVSPGRAAMPPGSARCRPSSIQSGWDCCTRSRPDCRTPPFWSTPALCRGSPSGLPAPKQQPRVWA